MVVISLNNKRLRRFLRGHPQRYSVANANEKDIQLPDFLQHYEQINLFDTTEETRDKHVRSYIALIDGLSQEYHSKYWWAYFASSKNRHSSKIFDDLYCFAVIVNRIEQDKTQSLIILNPPESIIRSLIAYLKSKGSDIAIIGGRPFGGYQSRLFTYGSFVLYTGARIALHLFRIISSKILLRHKYRAALKDSQGVFVFRSWFNNRSFSETQNYRDSFFGELCRYVKTGGRPVLILVGMFGVKFRDALLPLVKTRGYPVLPVEFFLKVSDVIKSLNEAIASRVVLRKPVYFGDFGDISSIIHYHLNVDFSRWLFQNIVFFYMAKNIARSVSVERFFLTSENNPWEKMFIQALREFSPSTRIVGFQHTIVSLAKLNYMLGEYCKKNMPLPDIIVTSGQVTHDILVDIAGYDPSMVKTGCALRFEKVLNFEFKKRRQRKETICLVALEGVNESACLVNFIYDILSLKDTYRVILRPHPVLPLTKMKRFLKFNPDLLPKNFVLSSNKYIIDDFRAADFLLYDSSTVCLEALAMGLPLIWVDLKRPVNYDPLFGCDCLKMKAASFMEINNAVSVFNRMEADEFIRQQELAHAYIKNYFYPINERNLQVFLQ